MEKEKGNTKQQVLNDEPVELNLDEPVLEQEQASILTNGATEDYNELESQEFVSKTVVVESDKVYISASIKLGLKNYSTINIDFGITKVVSKDENIEQLADHFFDGIIMPKVKQYASKLASAGYQMTNLIEARVNAANRKTYSD